MLVWRIVRRLMAMGVRFLVVRRGLLAAIAGVLLVGFVAGRPALSGLAPAVNRTAPGSVVAPSIATTTGVQSVVAVDNYLKGMSTFDAKLVWSSFTDDALKQMTDKGITLDGLQQNLNDQRSSGARYDRIAYIGSYPLEDGTQYVFYVVTAHGMNGADGVSQAFFVFTVSPDGKIAKIE